jgi:polyhydroxybutyrate depolymerase
MSGGHLRTYLLYVPPGDSKKHPLTLVLVYHGVDDTAIKASTETNLLSRDEQQHNMILAFLQGYDETWNEGAGDTPAHAAGINDVAFTSAVLGEIESRYAVNLRRVVATGLSNGALLTELLGCRLADNLTLIVPIEGQLPVTVSGSCRPSAPISVYEVHGTDDQTIPYGGGHFNGVGGGTTVLSAPASVARWAALDHCSKRAPTTRSGDYVLTGFTGCRQRVTATLNSVQGGQHVWPTDFAQTLLDVTTALPATRVAVKP